MREGQGIFKYKDGSIYNGDFKNDKCEWIQVYITAIDQKIYFLNSLDNE